jgi:hypothetical protein
MDVFNVLPGNISIIFLAEYLHVFQFAVLNVRYLVTDFSFLHIVMKIKLYYFEYFSMYLLIFVLDNV